MPLDPKHEADLLKQSFRRRKQAQQNIYFATAVDVTPLANYGYLIAQMKDGTTVDVQSWSNISVAAGNQIAIVPIYDKPWSAYVLIGVNASANVTTTPYVAPTQSGASLTSVDWSKIDTSTNKVNLGGQVAGILPVANQARQIVRQSFSFSTGVITGGATATGSVSGADAMLVRSVSLTGGSQATIALLEAPAGATEYLTASVGTPFTDLGPWIHYDTTNSGQFHWQVTNDGADASFTFAITGLSFAI